MLHQCEICIIAIDKMHEKIVSSRIFCKLECGLQAKHSNNNSLIYNGDVACGMFFSAYRKLLLPLIMISCYSPELLKAPSLDHYFD